MVPWYSNPDTEVISNIVFDQLMFHYYSAHSKHSPATQSKITMICGMGQKWRTRGHIRRHAIWGITCKKAVKMALSTDELVCSDSCNVDKYEDKSIDNEVLDSYVSVKEPNIGPIWNTCSAKKWRGEQKKTSRGTLKSLNTPRHGSHRKNWRRIHGLPWWSQRKN